jgi:hypothetical protein
MFFMTAPQAIWNGSMFAVAGLAAWRGKWEERTIAFGMVIDSLATNVFQNTRDWHAPQWADLAIDGAYLIVMVWVALKSNRLWPLWAAAFQLIDVAIYLAFIADGRVGALAPFAAIEIWSYLILIVVTIGTWQRWRDRRRAHG